MRGTRGSGEKLIAVVGADGFVGGALAAGLQATRVVYGPPRDGDIAVRAAEKVLREADVVINAGGCRVRRGLSYADYQRYHRGSNAVFLPWIRSGALFIHTSSAHVLGRSRHQKLGNQAPPNPQTYPSASYAQAKLEADLAIETVAQERAFRAIFLRPTILYDRPGDGSLPDALCAWARRGMALRLYPRAARHHLCHLPILVEVARRVVEHDALPNLSRLIVADPRTISSRGIEELITRYRRTPAWIIPVPARLLSALLRFTFHSARPRWDLRTWGDIFGVLHLDTEYDPSDTFRLLGMNPAAYAIENTLEPLVREALHD